MPPKKLDWPTGFANVSDTKKRVDFLRRIAGLEVFFLISPASGLAKILVSCAQILFNKKPSLS
jgi:hypothetical protein